MACHLLSPPPPSRTNRFATAFLVFILYLLGFFCASPTAVVVSMLGVSTQNSTAAVSHRVRRGWGRGGQRAVLVRQTLDIDGLRVCRLMVLSDLQGAADPRTAGKAAAAAMYLQRRKAREQQTQVRLTRSEVVLVYRSRQREDGGGSFWHSGKARRRPSRLSGSLPRCDPRGHIPHEERSHLYKAKRERVMVGGGIGTASCQGPRLKRTTQNLMRRCHRSGLDST